jgi:hypothetical protein
MARRVEMGPQRAPFRGRNSGTSEGHILGAGTVGETSSANDMLVQAVGQSAKTFVKTLSKLEVQRISKRARPLTVHCPAFLTCLPSRVDGLCLVDILLS